MSFAAHPHAPAAGTPLCRLSELADEPIIEVTFGPSSDMLRVIVTLIAGAPRAYINSCPHFQIPMNRRRGGFVHVGDVIWCAQHSAQFRLDDGYCIDGPCKAATLDAVPVTLDGDTVRIADSALP